MGYRGKQDFMRKGRFSLPSLVRHLYANGITAHGYYSLFRSIKEQLDYVFIIKGAPGTGKSTLVNNIASSLIEQKVNIEVIRSPKDNELLDGLIIPQLNIGLLVSSPPFTLEAKYIGATEEEIDLNEGLSMQQLATQKREIIQMIDQIEDKYDQAIAHLAKAKEIHIEHESIYIKHMDFEQANQLTRELISEIFSKHEPRAKKAVHRHLFLGATTPEGPVNSIDNLTESVKNRVIIKGRAGSGKSTILNKIVQEATRRGVSAEIFQCGFDPTSLDMVILPDLDYAILDGTPPHPIEPSREGDRVLDIYALCFEQDVDHMYKKELEEIVARYKRETSTAIKLIKEAKEVNDQLKNIYGQAMDFTKNMAKEEYVLRRLLTKLAD